MPDPVPEKPEDEPLMRACIVCGRWMALSKESHRVYCCEECSSTFETCRVCGSFFPAGKGPAPGFCSSGCMEDRNSYYSLFKELDE